MKKLLLGLSFVSFLNALTEKEIVNSLKFDSIKSLATVKKELNAALLQEGIKQVNDEQAVDLLLQRDGLVMLKFFADWCGPCRNWAPIVAQVSTNKSILTKSGKTVDALFIEINVDNYRKLAGKFGANTIPTGVVYFNGSKKEKIVGSTTKKALEDKIAAAIK